MLSHVSQSVQYPEEAFVVVGTSELFVSFFGMPFHPYIYHVVPGDENIAIRHSPLG